MRAYRKARLPHVRAESYRFEPLAADRVPGDEEDRGHPAALRHSLIA
jgi:hypothetical protein